MSLLVTGASGRLGRLLIDRLAAAGGVIRVLGRETGEGGVFPEGVVLCRGDLLDPPTLARAVRGVRKVVHLAAVTRSRARRSYYDVNVQGTKNLLAALGQEELDLFLHMSTRAVGERGGAYARSKLLAEAAVREAAVPAIILRPAEVCGTGAEDPVLSLAKMVRRSPVVPVIGSGRYKLAPLHVNDVLACVLMALDRPSLAGRTYTLAGSEIAFADLIETIAARLGLRRRRIHIPVAAAKAMIAAAGLLGLGPHLDRVDRLLMEKSADSSLAQRDLAFTPPTTAVVLDRILDGPGREEGRRA